ncbi:MAG: hypothetical protein ACC608_05205 [Anaerofustis sp.]|jgi:hypothetical protein
MLKVIIGIVKWKSKMKKLAKQKAYTDQWWNEVSNSLVFLPPEQRSSFFNAYINTMLQF